MESRNEKEKRKTSAMESSQPHVHFVPYICIMKYVKLLKIENWMNENAYDANKTRKIWRKIWRNKEAVIYGQWPLSSKWEKCKKFYDNIELNNEQNGTTLSVQWCDIKKPIKCFSFDSPLFEREKWDFICRSSDPYDILSMLVPGQCI